MKYLLGVVINPGDDFILVDKINPDIKRLVYEDLTLDFYRVLNERIHKYGIDDLYVYGSKKKESNKDLGDLDLGDVDDDDLGDLDITDMDGYEDVITTEL